MTPSSFMGSKMGTLLPLAKFNMAFGVLLLLGLVFFVVWASKNLSKDKLKMLWIWLVIIGALGCLLSAFGSVNKGRFYKEIRGPQGRFSVMMEMKRDRGMKVTDEDIDKTMNDIRMEMRRKMREEQGETPQE